jgi:hypothetical protein
MSVDQIAGKFYTDLSEKLPQSPIDGRDRTPSFAISLKI